MDRLVPEDIFYRKVIKHKTYIFYKSTQLYYGREGQERINPVVFFKILLVGYLTNIKNDRTLIRYCSNCLDVHLFLGYDFNEELLWHSTISRTCSLLGKEVFFGLFQEISRMCIINGMVCGKVIRGACASTSGSKDRTIFADIMDQTIDNLRHNDIAIGEVSVDTVYRSVSSFQYCDEHNLDAWIPNFGQYKPERESFFLVKLKIDTNVSK
ncbi:transposase [Sphingobacterium psychroaquaticum]|uniref:transposase n=1 Tax=Sphingobacterium psychroaquaticum TaxID=561061 RepID=UPI00190EECF5|nr:transposase [Sphingobacterium psychroaquaticum]